MGKQLIITCCRFIYFFRLFLNSVRINNCVCKKQKPATINKFTSICNPNMKQVISIVGYLYALVWTLFLFICWDVGTRPPLIYLNKLKNHLHLRVHLFFLFICEIISSSSKSSKYSLVSIIDEQQHKTVIRVLITKSLHGVELFSYWYFLKKNRTATHSRAHTHSQFTHCTSKKKKQDKRNCDLEFVLESRMSSLFLFFCSLHLILIWNEFPIEIDTLKWLLIEPESITVLIPLSLEWSIDDFK